MFLALFIFVILMAGISILLNARANELLTPEQRVLVKERGWETRLGGPILFCFVLCGLYFLTRQFIGYAWWLLLTLPTAVLAALILFARAERKRRGRLGLPAGYLRAARFSDLVSFIGALVYFTFLVYLSWNRKV